MFWIASFATWIAAVAVSFFRPTIAWIILSLPTAWMIFMRLSLGFRRTLPHPDLSAAANRLLSKFSHYYARPFVGSEYSSAASGLTFAAVIVAVIGLFKAYWWGLAPALIILIASSWLARQFNPTHFLVDESEREAHDEVLRFLRQRSAGDVTEPRGASLPDELMIRSTALDVERVRSMPFSDFFAIHLNLPDDELYRAALIGMSGALGNHPDLLNTDQGYRRFVDTFLKDHLMPYVVNVAALQLPLLSFGGRIVTGSVNRAYLLEARKVKSKLIPNEEAADLIFEHENSGWHFFAAVVALSALICKQQKKLAKLYGTKKKPWGKWMAVEE